MTDAARYLRTLIEAEDRTASAGWPEAVALWQQVVDANPVNGSHWDRLAQACYEAADYAEAFRLRRQQLSGRGRLPHRLLPRPAGRYPERHCRPRARSPSRTQGRGAPPHRRHLGGPPRR
jgi:hypothetical protein